MTNRSIGDDVVVEDVSCQFRYLVPGDFFALAFTGSVAWSMCEEWPYSLET